MMSIGRSEYAAYPNKKQAGFPTVFWFNQQLNSTINVWPVPTDDTFVLRGYYLKQIPEVGMQGGQSPQIPLYFIEAFTLGLAARLAMIWVPEKAQMLDAMSKESYQIACEQNVEGVNYYITPQMSGYFR